MPNEGGGRTRAQGELKRVRRGKEAQGAHNQTRLQRLHRKVVDSIVQTSILIEVEVFLADTNVPWELDLLLASGRRRVEGVGIAHVEQPQPQIGSRGDSQGGSG